MNAQDLKNSILQLAIQGKLVEQREEEGTAKELFEKIEAEKKQLIKEGKIKKQKKLPEIKEDEIPFDIPENWKWVRLGDLCNYGKCNSTPAKNIPKGAWLLDLEDIEKDSGKVLNKKRIHDVKSTSSKHIFKRGNVLYSKLRPYLNKVVIADEDGYSTSEILPLDFGTYVYNRYAQTVLMSPYFINYTVKCSYGVKMPRLGTTDGQLAMFPLAPLEEQKRIVAKIEELMPYVDKYDVAYSEVEELNKKFPEDMQKSILQYAIQGKLVEQREEDGTAEDLYKQIQEEKKKLIKEGKIKKTKDLPEITEDEIPFDIPENWKWVRLGDLGSYRKGPFGSALTKAIFVPKSENTVKVYEQKNAIQKDVNLGEYYITREYFESKMKGFELFPGDIIVSCAGTIGETYIMPDQFEQGIINQALMQMKLTPSVNVEYFLLYFDFILKKTARQSSKGSAIKNIPPFEELKSYLVPIPPLAEQKRIIERIEELLPYTKQLAKKPD